MKDLKDLVSESLNESKENVFNELFGFYFDGIEDEYDNDDEEAEDCKEFVENATSLINQFIKDNNIKSVNDVKIESSEDAFDFVNDEFYPDIEVVMSKDVEFEKNASEGFMGNGDVWLADAQSWRYDKKTKTLYMSSQSGAYMNGDYFDAKFTSKN